MKCDELKVYHCNEWHNEYTEFVMKSDVDAAIAELKEKLHDAEMAKDDAECANTEYRIDIEKLKAQFNPLYEELKRVKDENERLKKQRDELFTQGIQKATDLASEKLGHRTTRRALWLARAERAEAQWNRLLRDAGICFAVGRSKEWDIFNQKQKKWQNVERLCREKSEEYK